jgi:tetratricopeptide (TPR) repeat protein
VLRAKSGSLAQTPLPLLLHALLTEERSATLELKLRNLEKRVHFDVGVPVGCDSNLLHESLGRRLVDKGKLDEAQLHTLLSDSAATGKPLQALLVERQLVSGFELIKLLQANLGHTLLDTFRWADAQWRLVDLEEVDTPIRMNTAQLVFTGATQLPMEIITAHFPLEDSQELALLTNPQEELKLSAKDTRLVQTLKRRANVGALCALPGLSREDVLRRLYALCVLELVDLASVVDARPKTAEVVEAPAPMAPVAAAGIPYADEDEATMQKLANEFLSFRGKDPFDLLGVKVDTASGPVQRAFLTKCEAISPTRFRGADAKGKAEILLMVYARAFGSLSDPEQHSFHKKRRETLAANQKKGGPNPNAAAEHFKIRTELLDAKSQFDEGKKRLEAGQHKSAVEHFEYAADIEPRGRTLAYLALARFRLAPDFAAEKSLALLADACTREPACEEAWAFRADLALSLSRHEEAEDAYRKAMKLNPGQKRYAQALRSLGK